MMNSNGLLKSIRIQPMPFTWDAEFPSRWPLREPLKLKEISYIHAEGYPAAEMKHGPIALIDEKMPVVFIANHDSSYEKIVSNIQEVKARNGVVIAIVTEGDTAIRKMADHVIEIPQTDETLVAIPSVVPLQLIAYHIAVITRM